jgi:hypothetical protein
MDLPYLYNADGSMKQYNAGKMVKSQLQNAANGLLRGNPVSAIGSVLSGVNAILNGPKAEQKSQQTRSTMADVVMFSGCKDGQTSADTFVGGVGATGAMSYALIRYGVDVQCLSAFFLFWIVF